MEFTTAFGLYTAFAFLGFLSLCAWSLSQARQVAFKEAEILPFTDPEELARQRKALILNQR